jgi:hypothetical protein
MGDYSASVTSVSPNKEAGGLGGADNEESEGVDNKVKTNKNEE